MLAGALVRLAPALSGDFPIGDGGLFATMISDIQSNHYLLPATSSYNGIHLPFGYPPLALYLIAGLSGATGTDLIQWLRFYPVVMSLLTIPVFFLIAKRLLSSEIEWFIATFAFAAIPRAFNWEIIGGGVTRSTGFVFALLTFYCALRVFAGGGRRWTAALGVSAALTVLSHLEMAWFAAAIVGTEWVATSRSGQTLLRLVAAAFIAAALSSWWWGTVIRQHGVAPFVSALNSGTLSPVLALRILDPSVFGDAVLPVFLVLALLGLLHCVGTRSYHLPALFLVVFILDPRKAPTDATVGASLLVAISFTKVLLPITSNRPDVPLPKPPRTFTYGLLFLFIIGGLSAPFAKHSPLGRVDPEQQASLYKVGHTTPSGSKIAVITGNESWALDFASEWFPTLSERSSIATVQGYEWMGAAKWKRQQNIYKSLQECGSAEPDCLIQWAKRWQLKFDYVMVVHQEQTDNDVYPTACCAIERSLSASSDFEQVFKETGGTLFRFIPPGD